MPLALTWGRGCESFGVALAVNMQTFVTVIVNTTVSKKRHWSANGQAVWECICILDLHTRKFCSKAVLLEMCREHRKAYNAFEECREHCKRALRAMGM